MENILRLLDEGNTVPFIARYRKEMHGTTDDQTIRAIADRLAYLRGLDERKAAVMSAIEAQGKLTDELSAAIENAQTLAEVEDIYRPYKQKRRTRATIAREKGLAPLAELLLSQTVTSGTLEALAALAEKNDLIVVSDEIYEKLVYGGADRFQCPYRPDRLPGQRLHQKHQHQRCGAEILGLQHLPERHRRYLPHFPFRHQRGCRELHQQYRQPV